MRTFLIAITALCSACGSNAIDQQDEDASVVPPGDAALMASSIDLSPPPRCTPGCVSPTPYCNATNHCVSCLGDADCPAGTVCNVLSPFASECVQGCDGDERCHPDGGGASMACCNLFCTDTSVDAQNCGGCGMVCAAMHSQPTCVGSVCGSGVCDTGWADCNMNPSDGCEANLHTDPNNCDGCGKVCAFANAHAACADSCYIAACTFGWDDCDADPSNGCEKDVSKDPMNCGACGNVCPSAPNSQIACINSACAVTGCQQGFLDCDGNAMNGCEVNGATDTNNCGKCANVCPQGLVCRGSQCTCPQCNIPNASSTCQNNQCVLDKCNPGFGDCNNNPADGCEVNFNTDPNNCGGCGQVCPNNMAFCVNGACSSYVPPVECNQATMLDDPNRNVNNANANGSGCDTTANGWFQFVNRTGTKIPTQVVPISHCGTDAPGWMQGAYPNLGDGKVQREVCFNWAGNQCEWNSMITVINCGNYYVFQLPTPPVCNLRYCGTN